MRPLTPGFYWYSPKYDYDGTAHVVFLSDVHVGGERSLAPRNFMAKAGPSDEDSEPYRLNLCQRYLDACWRHMLDHLPKRFVFVFVGDLISGINRGVLTRNWTVDPEEQRDAAVELLLPIVRKADATYMCEGTPFHEPAFASAEREAAKRLRDKTDKPVRYADVHNVELLGHTINAVHSRSTVQDYPSTPTDKEIEGSILAEMIGSAPHADFIVRAHIHPNSFGFVSRHGKVGWFNLCWQVPDDYSAVGLARYYRRLMMLGTIVLELSKEPVPSGFKFHQLSYPLPPSRMRVQHVKW
jgi:hypothetical protein